MDAAIRLRAHASAKVNVDVALVHAARGGADDPIEGLPQAVRRRRRGAQTAENKHRRGVGGARTLSDKTERASSKRRSANAR
jgi:hypothetical protein